MQIRWSPDAAADLESIMTYICRDNQSVAQRVGQEIYERLSALGDFPYSGRLGRVEGTRELPLPPLPYIVIYRVLERASPAEIVNTVTLAFRPTTKRRPCNLQAGASATAKRPPPLREKCSDTAIRSWCEA